MNPHAVAHGPCSATPLACARARHCATGRSPRRRARTRLDGPTVGKRAAAPIIWAGPARVRPLRLRLEGSPMACLCSKQLGSLLTTVSATLSTQALVPAMPAGLLAATVGVSGPTTTAHVSASAAATAAASAQATLTAKLAAMASFAAAAKASMGLNATAALSASAQAALQASLTANVQSLNASGPMLQAAG